MGKIKEHLPVKLICGITFCPSIDPKKVISTLEKLHSPVDLNSETYDFSAFTPYYEAEMGKNLKKLFISFSTLIVPEKLPQIKIDAIGIEEKYCKEYKRRINIDPGYITQAKLVLATTKNYSHRIYLSLGIFGDVHMHYSKGIYQPQSWTYPDYKYEMNGEFFNSVRKRYLEQLGKLPK